MSLPAVLGIVVVVIVGLVAGLLAWLGSRPVVPADYTKTVATGGPIEARYLAVGPHPVANRTADALQYFAPYRLWFPADLATMSGSLPVVLVANGTGVAASKYPAWFSHLASWGFIVVGTDDAYSWSAFSQRMTARLLQRVHTVKDQPGWSDNPFLGRVDLGRVGIAGHSQGGVGVFNALADPPPGITFKAAYAASPTNLELAKNLDWEYDPSKATAPTLLTSSTGQGDAKLVVSLPQLTAIYDQIPASTEKVMMRRNDGDHGQMLYLADGYMTAWFMWHLQSDPRAKTAFTGPSPEALSNPLFQDQRANVHD